MGASKFWILLYAEHGHREGHIVESIEAPARPGGFKLPDDEGERCYDTWEEACEALAHIG